MAHATTCFSRALLSKYDMRSRCNVCHRRCATRSEEPRMYARLSDGARARAGRRSMMWFLASCAPVWLCVAELYAITLGLRARSDLALRLRCSTGRRKSRDACYLLHVSKRKCIRIDFPSSARHASNRGPHTVRHDVTDTQTQMRGKHASGSTGPIVRTAHLRLTQEERRTTVQTAPPSPLTAPGQGVKEPRVNVQRAVHPTPPLTASSAMSRRAPVLVCEQGFVKTSE